MTIVNTSSRVRKTEISVDAVALFDILLIALMMTLASSKFILSPGMGIDIESDALPEISSPENALTDEDMAQIDSLDKGKPFFEHNDEVLAGFLAYVPDVEGQK